MPVYKGMEIYVVNSKTKKIEGATNRTKIGNTLTNVNASSKMQRIVLDHKKCKCISRKHGNYLVAVTMEESVNSSSNIVAILIIGIYLTSSSCLLVLMLSRVLKEKYEKEKYMYTSNTDELNCAASNCMKFAFASYGKIYRIGGDEFVVLIQESVSNIDSILQVFDVTIHDWHGKYSNSISVSYGVVKSSEQDFDSVQEISKLADERMYQNKKDYYTTSCNDRRR